ncbi:MAG TPA: hypothetical protein VLQ93_25605 [Myxococcaceae bacterium]|nr:hypothetical protein [Myxococcaceae bacterium]
MSNQTKYLLTVDSKTGAATKLERVGEAGELTEVPLSTLAAAHAQPVAAMGMPPAAVPVVLNLYLGGYPGAAPLGLMATPAGWGMVPYGYGPMMPQAVPAYGPTMAPVAVAPGGTPGLAPTLAAPGTPPGESPLRSLASEPTAPGGGTESK